MLFMGDVILSEPGSSPGHHRFRRGGSLVPHTYVDLRLCCVDNVCAV